MKGIVSKIDWTLSIAFASLLVLGGNVALAASVQQSLGGTADPFGSIDITMVTTPDCADCFDLQPLKEYLTQNGVEADQIKEVAYDSKEGQKLIKTYDVKRVPTAIIPGSMTDLEYMAGIVENLGSVTNDAFVVSELQPPYIDLATNQVVGRFDIVILSDATCTECYSVDIHDEVLDRLAMKPSQKTVVDIASDEGKALIENYTITAVPTILLRGDLTAYDTLQEIWTSVGTIEDDGTYVLRQGVKNMGTYKQIPQNVIVKPEPQQPTT